MPEPALSYVCDQARHLICLPYSVENLHRMARELDIHPGWFHNKPGRHHYDIPKGRRKQIQHHCRVVSSREIVRLLHWSLALPVGTRVLIPLTRQGVSGSSAVQYMRECLALNHYPHDYLVVGEAFNHEDNVRLYLSPEFPQFCVESFSLKDIVLAPGY